MLEIVIKFRAGDSFAPNDAKLFPVSFFDGFDLGFLADTVCYQAGIVPLDRNYFSVKN